MITNMDEQREKEALARELAAQVADLLNRIEDLSGGPVNGQLSAPGCRVRFIDQWEVTD